MNEIKIRVSAGTVLHYGNWDAFCQLKGISEWAINEGRMSSSEEFDLTPQEAYQVGLRGYAIRALENASHEPGHSL